MCTASEKKIAARASYHSLIYCLQINFLQLPLQFHLMEELTVVDTYLTFQ